MPHPAKSAGTRQARPSAATNPSAHQNRRTPTLTYSIHTKELTLRVIQEGYAYAQTRISRHDIGQAKPILGKENIGTSCDPRRRCVLLSQQRRTYPCSPSSPVGKYRRAIRSLRGEKPLSFSQVHLRYIATRPSISVNYSPAPPI